MRTERVLDLFSGKGGWSQPWKDAGHEVVTLDFEPRFGADLTMDVRDLTPEHLPWSPTVVLASPPCEKLSTGGLHGHHFVMDDRGRAHPVTDQGRLAVSLVEATLRIIEETSPRYFVIENPRALMRKLGIIPFERRTVWYCHYGEERGKPTDLWGGFPRGFVTPPLCHNRVASHPEGCCCFDHNAAPRGSVTGTQGMKTEDAALVPYALAKDFMDAALGMTVGHGQTVLDAAATMSVSSTTTTEGSTR